MASATQFEVSNDASAPKVDSAEILVWSGRNAVLSRANQLERLAEQSGQPGAMHGLAFLVDQEYAARKTPHLVGFYDDKAALMGTVLVFEYKLAGWNTGIMATGDSFGVRTVIGPASLRTQLAMRACAFLLKHHAAMILISFKNMQAFSWKDMEAGTRNKSRLWAMQTRTVRDSLPLDGTLQKTLARMGKRTRTHLRYYQRNLEKAVPCVFLQNAGELISATEGPVLAEINRRSLDPVPQAHFDLQFRSAMSLPGGFISGLRSERGQWLAIAGGWRQGGTTWVQWQTNAAGYESLSLGTALRAYLIEEEIRRGSTCLAFHGGTSHSMSHAFTPEQLVDLIAIRPCLRGRLLIRCVPWLYRAMPFLESRGNFVGDVLRSEDLRWLATEELVNIFAAMDDPLATSSVSLNVG